MHSPFHVYSPLQNIALWLQSWLCGLESYDAFEQSLNTLGGPHMLTTAAGEQLEGAYLARFLRTLTTPQPHVPWCTVLLAGPGQPLLAAVGGQDAIVLRRSPQDDADVLTPSTLPGSGTQWQHHRVSLAPHLQHFLMPGEADTQLRLAVEQAATVIEGQRLQLDGASKARMTVGTLRDYFDSPGIPASIPSRARKLIARADSASAVVEAMLSVLGEHSMDPALLSLSNPIRQARMSAVAYSAIELARAS